MTYGDHMTKGIHVTSEKKCNAHRMRDKMKPRRKLMFLVVFVVVVTIVMLTSFVSDVTFKTQQVQGLQQSSSSSSRVQPSSSLTENLKRIADLRKFLFPLRMNTAKQRDSKSPDLKNATITGFDVLKTRSNLKKAVSSYSLSVKQNGLRKGGYSRKRTYSLKDPLVIESKVDPSRKRVPFLAPISPIIWRGRDLGKDYRETCRQDEEYHYLQDGIQSGGLNISRLAEFSMADRMSPWEWNLFTDPPIANISEVGSELHSKVYLVFPPTGPYKVGDNVTVRVDIYDGLGRAKKRGGDEIRVWLKERAVKAAAGFHVQDLGNGSYLATGKLLWPGRPQIRASLAYPREIIRTVYYLRNIMKGLRLNAGGFQNSIASETTICSPFPFSGMYRYLCNLTSLNYGLSWYCGKPEHPTLLCRHWKEIRDLEFPNPLPINLEEGKWFKDLGLGHKHYLRLMNRSVIAIKVLPSKVSVIKTSLPCNRRPAEDTWKDTAPRGLILHNQWLPLSCALPVVDVNYVNQCLKGSILYMIGDSNLRHMLEMMAFLQLCIPTKPLLGKRNWHTPQTCVNHENYYAVKWRTHALPFHTNNDHWAPRTNQQAVGLSLDGIPSTGKYFVLLHMYLHFTTHHYSVYRDRIRSMKQAVARLMQRNPATKVVIRGPHVAYQGWSPILGGDIQGPRYMEILKEEFKSLQDKVYLLDFWDFSIAAESQDFHPKREVTQEMLRTFFGYVCQ